MLILSDSLKLYKVGENGLKKGCSRLGQRCTNNSLVELGLMPQFMATNSISILIVFFWSRTLYPVGLNIEIVIKDTIYLEEILYVLLV